MGASALKKKPVILITGCSSGVGLTLAKLLYERREYRVIVTSREKSISILTDQFKDDDRFIVRAMDLLNPHQISEVVTEIYQSWGGVDILINNAGVSYRSVVEQMDEESEMEQIRTNYLGPMRLIRQLLPSMRERGSGQIINISSVSGILGMPTMGSYSASKHALEGATTSLWFETRALGINVSIVRPGFINSDAYSKVLLSKKAKLTEKIKGPYSEFYTFFSPFIERFMKISRATPESVAKRILRLTKQRNPPLYVNATLDAHVFEFIKRYLPTWFTLTVFSAFLPKAKTRKATIDQVA